MAKLLTNETFARMMRMLNDYESGAMKAAFSDTDFVGSAPIPTYLIQLNDDLPAMDDMTPGQITGNVICKFDKTDIAVTTLETVIVYNNLKTKIDGETIIGCWREPTSGQLFPINNGEQVTAVRGTLNGALAAKGMADITTSTGDTVSVTDFDGYSGAAGKHLEAILIDGVMTVISMECS